MFYVMRNPVPCKAGFGWKAIMEQPPYIASVPTDRLQTLSEH